MLCVGIMVMIFNSCKKKEDALPRITFKSSTGYQVGGGTLPPKTAYVMGINLKSSISGYENKTFTVTRSFNGGPDSVIFSKELSGKEADSYYYEMKTSVDSVSGNYYHYTFTAVNEESYINQIQAKMTAGN